MPTLALYPTSPLCETRTLTFFHLPSPHITVLSHDNVRLYEVKQSLTIEVQGGLLSDMAGSEAQAAFLGFVCFLHSPFLSC